MIKEEYKKSGFNTDEEAGVPNEIAKTVYNLSSEHNTYIE